MKIYLAGNNGMEKEHRENLYTRFVPLKRLLSYFEIQPGRFAGPQWKWINENLLGKRSTGARGERDQATD